MGNDVIGWGVGFLLFGTALILHSLLWRYVVAARRYPVLFFLFSLPPFCALAHSSTAFWVATCCSLNYLAIFPAFQASSPTLVMLNHLLHKPKITEGELRAIFEESVIVARLNDLKSGGFVREEDEGLRLSWIGRSLAVLFRGYRGLMRLPSGDGG